MTDAPHLSARENRLLKALDLGRQLIGRQASDSDNAVRLGNGYLYFTIPGGRHIPAPDVASLAEKGFLVEQGDGLFGRGGQTLRLADPLPDYTTGRRRKRK